MGEACRLDRNEEGGLGGSRLLLSMAAHFPFNSRVDFGAYRL